MYFRSYLKTTSVLPPIPTTSEWLANIQSAGVPPMFGNDTLGDCVEAASGHMIQQWNYCAAHPFTPTLAQIIAAYSGATGYVPGDPLDGSGNGYGLIPPVLAD
jgi:hypothetical protein